MNLIIAGSRDWFSVYQCEQALSEFTTKHMTDDDKQLVIISGGARGADKCGEFTAKLHDIPCMVIPADWDKYGRSAGFKRNHDMAAKADALLAFWDGKSRGTAHMIDVARKNSLIVEVIMVGEGKSDTSV